MWWIAVITMLIPEVTPNVATLRIEQGTVSTVGAFSVGLVSVSIHKDAMGDFVTAKLSISKSGTEESTVRLTVKDAQFNIGEIPVQVKEIVRAQSPENRSYILLTLQPVPKRPESAPKPVPEPVPVPE